MELNGYKNGELGNGRKKEDQNGLPKLTLDKIAQELNISKTNLKCAFSHAQLYTMFSRVKSYVGYVFICYNDLI